MADSSKAKNFNISVTSEFIGYNSSRDMTNIARNVLVRGSKNVYKTLSGTIAVRPGQKLRGEANTTESAVTSEYVWNTSWGALYVLVVSDSTLSVVIDDVWYPLLTGLTKTRYVFDKWWDNTEKKDRALFVKGDSDIQHWSGGYATVLSATVNTITKGGTTSWQQAGFSTTSGEKKIMISGVEYTYTGGESTTTLTGVTPDPSAIAVGTVALQSVITESNKPAAGFMNDFIKVINNQEYVGSYTSRLCYISKNTDFRDYTVPTPRAPGDPELITLDATLNGIGVRKGEAHIGFGSKSWAVISFKDITVGSTLTQQTKVDIKPVALLQAPLAHEFIDNVGDSLVYLAQDNQVRSFGDFTNLFSPGYPSLSQEVSTELSDEVFTGGNLRCIGEFVYVTAPNAGNLYLYQVRQSVDQNGQVVAERLWHPHWVSNFTRIDEINGTVVGFSNANPQIYDVWTDQYHDDSPSGEFIPYECVAAFAYRNGDGRYQRRQGLVSFDKVFTEGYITLGTPLSLQVSYNYLGASGIVNVPVNSETRPAYVFTPNIDSAVSLGDASLGDESLGGGDSEGIGMGDLVKFKVINSFSLLNCFEYQCTYSSDAPDARWEILAVGDNAEVEPDENANYIINKLRN